MEAGSPFLSICHRIESRNFARQLRRLAGETHRRERRPRLQRKKRDRWCRPQQRRKALLCRSSSNQRNRIDDLVTHRVILSEAKNLRLSFLRTECAKKIRDVSLSLNMTRIAVTFALPAESSEFVRRLRDRTRTARNGVRIVRGAMGDQIIEVLHTGVGEKVCRERMAKFLQDQQFDLLISTGFAGALNDELQVGDLLLAKNFSTIDASESHPLLSNLRIHRGDLLTVHRLIDSSEERDKIGRASGGAAVDMETEFIARACAENGVPLLSLRVITDTPRKPFPVPTKVLFDIEQQRTRLLRLATFFLGHPNRAPRMVQFARRIAHARKLLASALIAVVRNL